LGREAARRRLKKPLANNELPSHHAGLPANKRPAVAASVSMNAINLFTAVGNVMTSRQFPPAALFTAEPIASMTTWFFCLAALNDVNAWYGAMSNPFLLET